MSGETRLMLATRPSAISTVKNCWVVPSPLGLGRKNLKVPSMISLLHSALAMSGEDLSIRLRMMTGS